MSDSFIGPGEIAALFRSIVTDETRQFEDEFSRYIGAPYALATNYGRTAIYAAVRVIGGTGNEVIIPALTCDVVTEAVTDAGAVPVFVDVSPDTLDIDISDLENKISNRTKAILVIHYSGKPAGNILQIAAIAREHNIVLIEDCAHALGTAVQGKKAGLFGDISIFSLTKTLLSTDGGMFCTSSEHYYTAAKDLLSSGSRSRAQRITGSIRILVHGYKSTADKVFIDRIGTRNHVKLIFRVLDVFPDGILRLSEIVRKRLFHIPDGPAYHRISRAGAGIGRVQLSKLPFLLSKRNAVFNALKIRTRTYYYTDDMTRDILPAWMDFPMAFPGIPTEKVIDSFKKQGITVRPTWPAYQKELNGQRTKNTEKIRDRMLLWRIHPDTTEKELQKFVEACSEFIHKPES